MNEFFLSLTQTIAVTGAEQRMTSLIAKKCGHFSSVNISSNRSVTVSPQKCTNKQKIAIFVPIDFPGFIVLSTTPKQAFLSPIGKLSKEVIKDCILLDEYGNEHKLIVSDDEYFVNSEKLNIGDVLQPKINITKSNLALKGLHAGRIALINALVDVTKTPLCQNAYQVFATGSQGNAPIEAQIAKKISPSAAVLLGTLEDSGSRPIMVVKDGKNLSDRVFLQETAEKLHQTHIPYKMLCSEKAITKSEDITSNENIPTLTIALPIKNKGKVEEQLKLEAYLNFVKLLETLLK